jgi:maleate isomerase
MNSRAYRIGQIVPSSNTTMETEIPAMLRAREMIAPERFTFHSSRMRMKKVTAEELRAMDADSDRCALELSDARVDILGYACLVAIMSMGRGYHRTSQDRLHQRTVENGAPTPVVTSAGALVDGIHTLNAKRVSVITPYMKPLTAMVVDYIEAEGISVHDHHSLEIPDNLEVGARDPFALVELYKNVDLTGIDALVLSALPVVSAAVCTVHQMLKQLNLDTRIPGGGALLSGRY